MLNPSQAYKFGYVASNQLLTELCVFARNVIVARIVGAETLGEFIFLVLSIRLFAMSTDLAAERHIISVKDKEIDGALAAAHFTARIRGGLLAIILLFMGLYNVQGISFLSYLLLALAALVRGYTHQGYRLHQRSLNFRPALYVEGITVVLGTIGIFFATSMAPTLEAVCACMLLQGFMHTALSHIMSDTAYRSDFDMQNLNKLFHFGTPLLLTGVTMFWSMQGERVILSALLPTDAFAHFSMMFQLALVPVLVLSRMTLTIGLPMFAAERENSENFEYKLKNVHIWVYGLAVFFMAGFIFFANPVLTLMFGADFKAETIAIFLVALAQALRLCRAPQSVAAQALGQTDIPFKANLVRVFAVLVAITSVMSGGSLVTLLIIACFGEGAAWTAQGLMFSLRNRRTQQIQAPQPQEILQ